MNGTFIALYLDEDVSSLIKRGREWHGPDRMILNEKAIVFVEPVGRDSRVSQLIEDAKKKTN